VIRPNLLPLYLTVGAALSGAALLGCGCAGTSPQLAAPSLSSTSGGAGGGTGSRSATSAASEANLAPLEAVKTPAGTFLALPYLQLGAVGTAPGKSDALALLWQTPDDGKAGDADTKAWAVEIRPAGSGAWKKSGAIESRRVAAGETSPHRVWAAPLTGLAPGALFDYRVTKAGVPVFTARARARRTTSDSAYRFVVFGDCGMGNASQKRVAYQTSLTHPEFVFLTGDIVYQRGLVSEYQKNFFPIYNAETAAPDAGAPLMRSALFLAAPGNHDLEYRDFEKWPDALAYFYYWRQPTNGPALKTGGANTPRPRNASETAEKAFLAGAGDTYPRGASYSFDYGNAHWTVLDSNFYVDWSDPALRAWVEKDLAAASKATWRFVAFHHPPFHTSKEHRNDQQMRVLCDLFEKYKVDVVWSGHVHNYQRAHPLRFAAQPGADGKLRGDKGQVEGKWTLDTAFDGEKKTKPDGVLYVTTGAGGAGLYSPDVQQKPSEWLPFIAKYVADTHSFTQVDVNGPSFTVRQISDEGKELDKFTVTK
jgi:hypothetical protein